MSNFEPGKNPPKNPLNQRNQSNLIKVKLLKQTKSDYGKIKKKSPGCGKVENRVDNPKLHTPAYLKIRAAITNLPFVINKKFHNAVAAHIMRIGFNRFEQCANRAINARDPERYLMKCLVNENQACGVQTAQMPGLRYSNRTDKRCLL